MKHPNPHYPRHFQYFHKKVPGKKCLLRPHSPRYLKYIKKIALQKILYIRTITGTFKMSIKSVWQRSVLCIRKFPGTFYIFKKVPGKRCHLLPHFPRHLTFLLQLVHQSLCIFGEKSAWGKKVPGMQHPSIPHITQACAGCFI